MGAVESLFHYGSSYGCHTDHMANGWIITETAGENLVFGEVCYLKNDGKWWKAQGNAAATMPGMAVALGTINADADGDFLKLGWVRDDTWNFTVGAVVYVDDDTAGLVTETAPPDSGDQVQELGHAETADIIWFNPTPKVDAVP